MHKALLIALAVAVLGGCGQKKEVVAGRSVAMTNETVREGGLAVTIQVPREQVAPDQYVDVYVRVTNMTEEPITIPSDSERPVRVTVYRSTPLGFARVKDLLAGPVPIHNGWTLAPGQQKVFHVPVLIGQDFPRSSYVRLVATISGQPKIQPGVTLWVLGENVKYTPDY